MNNLFLTMLTFWGLGYFDDDSDDSDDSDEDYNDGGGKEDDVPPWFKPPYWNQGPNIR